MNNLFSSLPTDLPLELTKVLAESKSVRIERIVSHGHASPDGLWYDQDKTEWVVVLKGRAKMLFEGDGNLRRRGNEADPQSRTSSDFAAAAEAGCPFTRMG